MRSYLIELFGRDQGKFRCFVRDLAGWLAVASLIATIGCGGNPATAGPQAASPVTAAAPVITTSTLASGSVGETYNATLTAEGGNLPYHWNVISGTLPLGIRLNASTGAIGGTPSVTGQSSLVVGVTDTRNQVARQNLDLLVSSNSNCGPPTYPCSRSDNSVIIPGAPPQLGATLGYYGGHSGSGIVAVDAEYGNRILRVTDGNTTKPGMSFGIAGTSESSVTSYDESLLFLTDEGNTPCLVQFDRNTFTTNFHGCYGNIGIGNLQFGYTAANNNAFFSYSHAALQRFVIKPSDWTISSDPTFNHGKGGFWPDGPLCLSGQLAAEHVWYVHDTGLSSDDSTFIAALGTEQDKDAFIVVWNATKGCRWMNVKTWQVSSGWNTGLANPVNIAWASGAPPTSPGGVHNVNLDRSGTYGVLAINATGLISKVFWTIDTNEVNDTCLQCISHWACDFGSCLWQFGPWTDGFVMRDLAVSSSEKMNRLPGTPDILSTAAPAPGDPITDEHASHANASPDSKNIYLLSLQPNYGASIVGGPWEDEIIGVNWDGSKRTIRFNKNWNSGYGFSGNARCAISRQGNYSICSSDYQMYNVDKGFGNGLNQDTCNHTALGGTRGTNGCRTDVLLFELR